MKQQPTFLLRFGWAVCINSTTSTLVRRTFVCVFIVTWYQKKKGEKQSDSLASVSAILYAVIGVLASPVTGFVFDKVGILRFCAVFLLMQTVATLLIWPASFVVQTIVSVLMFSLYSFWLTFESKTPAVFAPPDLYGSYLGFSNSLTGILQLVLNLVIPTAIGSSLKGKWFYLAPVIILMELGVFCLFVFCISLLMSPAPSQPPLLSENNEQVN